MKTQNSDLLRQAREALSGRWVIAIAGMILILLVSGLVQVIPRIGPLLTIVISGPIAYGIAKFSLSIARQADVRIEYLFDGFQDFGRTLVTYLLMVVYILLFLLLLIVPGIIRAISYSMTFYILNDDDEIKPSEALELSREMMDGYKLQYFYLMLIFFGLGILCIFTLGIGFFFLMPFAQVTVARFYQHVKMNYE
ncbi:MAG: DUF975 family protein [Saprospiraceae bacterium]|nr:DUF975 family protein [Saprospiraceae bacterium]